MQVVAIWTIKGGVGKTAAAVNLAALAAKDGLRTLLWDLDAQGAASFYFRVKAKVKGGGRKLLRRSAELRDLVRATDIDGLDLLPADFSYRRLDLDLDSRKKPTRRLALKLAPLANEYDLVLLDCPPSVSLATESVLGAADLLVVPAIPTVLSLRSLEQVRSFATKVGRRGLQVLPFLSMVDLRRAMHRDILAQCQADKGFLATVIPTSCLVEKMGLHRAPISNYAPASEAARAFARLWDELAEQITSHDSPSRNNPTR